MASIVTVNAEPTSRRLVATCLRNQGHHAVEAEDFAQAMQILLAESLDLMLIELQDSVAEACEFLLRVRSEQGVAQPQVLLQSAADVEAETRALAHAFGASFVAKAASPEMLAAAVDAALTKPAPQSGSLLPDVKSPGLLARPLTQSIRHVAECNTQLEMARTALDSEIKKRIWAEHELTQANQLLFQQAMRDPLTGLHNRRFLEESLAREENRVRRSGQPLAVMMIDIDRFKEFNDTLGHAAGDALLRSVGQCIVSALRREDIAARYGGDEFTVVMAHASQRIACQRAELIRQNVRRLEHGDDGPQLGPVSLSIGIAAFPDDGESGEKVLLAADAALIRSKQAGRNRIAMGDVIIG